LRVLAAPLPACCILLCCLFCVKAGAAAPAEDDSVTETRPFRGLVRRDMAECAAGVAAELGVYERAARILAKEPDMHFVGGPEAPGPRGGALAQPSLFGAVRMMFSAKLLARGVEGFPPNLLALVRLRLERPGDLRAALLTALTRQDLLELHAQAHESQAFLLEKYDALAAQLLPLDARQHGGMEILHNLQSVVNEMRALTIFLELLPLHAAGGSASQESRDGLLRAEQLAPDNPLILTSLAELHLQLGKAAAALDYVSRALQKNPGYARAHDVRGAVLLRDNLPALAVDAFSRAIALSPRNALYYTHRASAHLIQEEESDMCLDFQNACGLGDCEGLQWAKGAGKCGAPKP
jgi:tetratricopeptide (TPR) repeat protein